MYYINNARFTVSQILYQLVAQFFENPFLAYGNLLLFMMNPLRALLTALRGKTSDEYSKTADLGEGID